MNIVLWVVHLCLCTFIYSYYRCCKVVVLMSLSVEIAPPGMNNRLLNWFELNWISRPSTVNQNCVVDCIYCMASVKSTLCVLFGGLRVLSVMLAVRWTQCKRWDVSTVLTVVGWTAIVVDYSQCFSRAVLFCQPRHQLFTHSYSQCCVQTCVPAFYLRFSACLVLWNGVP